MNEIKVGGIVFEAFEKARENCAKDSKYALSKYIESNTDLSSKTLERAYGKYVKKDGKKYELSEDSIDLLCRYLGYDNYEDYVTIHKDKNVVPKGIPKKRITPSSKIQNEPKRWIYISISIIFGAVLIVTLAVLRLNNKPALELENKCMTWVRDHYEEISCIKKPYSQYGTEVVPYEELKILNFKKIEVTMITDFFAEVTNKPLIWYTKNKDGEIEYFTSPGLHPITGKTLDEITPYIIQKYVPLHSDSVNSFTN